MKLVSHPAASRGYANHGWLQANYSFSFANFYNPDKLNFGALRVLNDDLIAPGMGFGTHPHDNMEIITIPLSGQLKHKDSMRNQWETVKAGEVQVMSAASGIQHSEINGSKTEHLSLFQIWIIPNKKGGTPSYDHSFFETPTKGVLQVLVSSVDSTETSGLKIHQDAQISRLHLSAGGTFEYALKTVSHGVYVMQVYGSASVASQLLVARDAVGIWETAKFEVVAAQDTELLCIEVPML